MPIKHADSVEFGRAMCRVLGLSTDKVMSMSFSIRPREPVTVTVGMRLPELTNDELQMIAAALRKDDKTVFIELDSPLYRISNAPRGTGEGE